VRKKKVEMPESVPGLIWVNASAEVAPGVSIQVAVRDGMFGAIFEASLVNEQTGKFYLFCQYASSLTTVEEQWKKLAEGSKAYNEIMGAVEEAIKNV